MSQRHREVRKDFSGGLNTRDRVSVLHESESADMRNVVVGKRGTIESRRGGVPVLNKPVTDPPSPGVMPPPVTSIYEYVDQSGGAHFMAFAGDSLKRLDVDEWSEVKGGFTENTMLEFAVHPQQNKLLFVNGADGYFESNGITAEQVDPYNPTQEEEGEIGQSTVPGNPKLIAYFDYRVWLANVTGFPDRIYLSVEDLNGNTMYNYFTPWSWLRATNKKGEYITALRAFGDRLLVFTRTTITAILPTEPFQIAQGSYIPPAHRMQEISYSVGAVSQRSIGVVGGNLIFMGVDGVYIFDGTNAPQQVSHRVGPTIQGVRRHYWDQVCAVAHNDKYYLSIPAKAGEW